MGLAASQVRLLQLTARMHNIEYQAQKIQAQKLQLANETEYVYKTYMNALDAKKIQYKYVASDGSIEYKDANFKNLFSYPTSVAPGDPGIQAQYALEILYDPDPSNIGKFYVDSKVASAYKTTSPHTAKATFAADTSLVGSPADPEKVAYYERLWDVLDSGKGIVQINSSFETNSEWLTNVIANGQVLIHKFAPEEGEEGNGAWINSSVTTDVLLQEVSDEKEIKKAEATYEAETKKINRKDAKYDTELSATETERNAVKTQMEDLKTTRSDNVNMAFKLFS